MSKHSQGWSERVRVLQKMRQSCKELWCGDALLELSAQLQPCAALQGSANARQTLSGP